MARAKECGRHGAEAAPPGVEGNGGEDRRDNEGQSQGNRVTWKEQA